MANQFRNYCLTVNNPVQTDEEFSDYLKALPHIKYFIFQRERGEETGTPHFQLYIEFEVGKTFMTVKEYFPTAHIQSRRGSKTKARDYCRKDDTRIDGHTVYEHGEFTESGERSDLVEIVERIRNGATEKEIEAEYPSQYLRYYKNIQQLRQNYLECNYGKTFREIKVTFIYGAARLGKTSYVYDLYPIEDICRINNYERGTYETYTAQKVLVLDEFTGAIDITFLNNILDKYPLELPSRFVNRTACFTEVCIISNLSLNQLYKEIQATKPEVYAAFIARIKNIIKFTGFLQWHYELKDGERIKVPLSKQVLIPLSDEEAAELPF